MTSVAERASRLLLRFYPEPFRSEYGEDVITFVRARATEPRHSTRVGRLRLLTDVLADGIAGAVREHRAIRARQRTAVHPAHDGAATANVYPPEELMVTLA